MFKKNPQKTQGRIDSLIGAGTKIEGNLSFSGGLRVDGEIYGNITASEGQPSTLVISEQARVEGEVLVSHVVVNGTVVGPLRSSGFLELQPKARVEGDVEYNSVEIQLGAVVEGKLIYKGSPAQAAELNSSSTA